MKEILKSICTALHFHFISCEGVHGGDINRSFKIETKEGPFFIKLNDAARFPGMLMDEAEGLQLLKESKTIIVPEAISSGVVSGFQYLMLEWISTGRPQPGFWETFGGQLAQLHGNSRSSFGLHFDNYIGTLRQFNTDTNSFVAFYTHHRILPLAKKLLDNSIYHPGEFQMFEKFCCKLNDLIPDEKPALLHGDLWAGNYLINERGQPVLIDPAPYFGHREADIAMTRLFGGFDNDLYDSYHYHNPLQPGWEKRVPIFQLYPLLVHAVLFGGGYIPKCLQIINHYTK
ncbi:MAG: fructosamine kinase family protein [Chitinophagaceae bacterium]|nr:fructosamine kinase family protein [Chitinophagaceae bacterium]